MNRVSQNINLQRRLKAQKPCMTYENKNTTTTTTSYTDNIQHKYF